MEVSMERKECIIIEELLPLYIENITTEQAGSLIAEHLKTCKSCNETYQKMKIEVRITTGSENAKPRKQTLWYLNSLKIWYLLCPVIALVCNVFQLNSILKLYGLILAVISVVCILSDFFSCGTWWDMENLIFQQKAREEVKRKRGIFYTRPILWALPAILVLLVLVLPQILSYICTYMI